MLSNLRDPGTEAFPEQIQNTLRALCSWHLKPYENENGSQLEPQEA